uniref:Uncharacterized protein n=1 Tax=Anguilla anguilla TaxID=7936 RepID=A0A0E9TEX7_ANGAN
MLTDIKQNDEKKHHQVLKTRQNCVFDPVLN